MPVFIVIVVVAVVVIVVVIERHIIRGRPCVCPAYSRLIHLRPMILGIYYHNSVYINENASILKPATI